MDSSARPSKRRSRPPPAPPPVEGCSSGRASFIDASASLKRDDTCSGRTLSGPNEATVPRAPASAKVPRSHPGKRCWRDDEYRKRLGIKLTESVDTWASNSRGGTCDRKRTGKGSNSAPGNHSPRPGSDRQRRPDVPLLRDHPAVLLGLVSTLRGVRGREPAGPLFTPACEPKDHSGGGRRQDHLPAPELPLRRPCAVPKRDALRRPE